MTPDRIDQLLDAALRTGTIPAESTPEERAQLEVLIARAGDLRLNAARVEAEARDAMPAARARFQRHLAGQRTPVSVSAVNPQPKPGFLSRFLGGRGMAFVTSAATIGVIAVVAVLVLQPFSAAETANALTVDDYVQVQGVVSAASDGSVTVQCPGLGDVAVAVTDTTAVSDTAGARQANSLKPGDPVVVSGVVTNKRAIAASNVAVAQNQAAPQNAGVEKIPLLQTLRESLQGTITVMALSPNGQRARLLIETTNARFLVDVDPKSMDQFLADHPGAIGAKVRVVEAPDLPKGVFRLQPLVPPGETLPSQPGQVGAAQFQNVRGIVTALEGNVLTVQTARGPVLVVVRPLTVIRSGQSEITGAEVRTGNRVVGQEVNVTGNLENTPRKAIIATLLIVLGDAPAR